MKSITMALIRLWLCFSLVAISLAAELNSACSNTINSAPGVCIQLPRCPELYALYVSRPLPHATIQLLKRAQCGYMDRQPLVCCRLSARSVTTAATTTTTYKPVATTPTLRNPVKAVPPPVDVSGHQNLALINREFCGMSSSIRIVGGNKTGLYEFPWMTLLNYQVTNRRGTTEAFKCGGTLINQRYILTAAHCISNNNKLRLISVRLGEHNTDTEEDCDVVAEERHCAPPYQNINVESFVRHPEYNARTQANDIALIRLSQPADTTQETVRPICLPVGLAEQTRNLDGKKLVVAGWGFTEDGVASKELLKVSLPIMSVEDCHNVYQPFGYSVNGNQLCAGGSNLTQDSCRGDSGGPLKGFSTVNSDSSMVQYGIVSYGHRNCGTAGVPGVYTRVGHYMDWILNTIRP